MKMLWELATFQKAERQAKREMADAHTQRCIEEHQRRMQEQRNAAMIRALGAQMCTLSARMRDRQDENAG